MWPCALPVSLRGLFNFSPCWSDYSNGHPWGAVIRLLVVVEPVAKWMPTTAPTTLCSWTAPNRYPLLQPLLGHHILPLGLKTYCVMRLADGNLFVMTADAAGQRPLFSIFTITYFWSESKVGLFQSLSALECGVILGWSFFSSVRHPSSCPSVSISPWMDEKKNRILLFVSTAVYSTWRLGCPVMRLRPNDRTLLLEISPHTLLICVWSSVLMEAVLVRRDRLSLH